MAQAEAARSKSGSTPARVSRSEDAFAADVDDVPAMKGKRPATGASTKAAKADPAPDSDGDEATSSGTSKSTTGKTAAKPAPSQPSTRAASLLQIGKNLEKSGKSSVALGYYKRIVKDYPDTPAAKTAKQRIKAIEKP